MARGTATYSGEEVEVEFSTTGTLTDYGVDRSPTWIEWEDIEIEELTILGHNVDHLTLPDELVEAIRELADEVEFEAEEPDYD